MNETKKCDCGRGSVGNVTFTYARYYVHHDAAKCTLCHPDRHAQECGGRLLTEAEMDALWPDAAATHQGGDALDILPRDEEVGDLLRAWESSDTRAVGDLANFTNGYRVAMSVARRKLTAARKGWW